MADVLISNLTPGGRMRRSDKLEIERGESPTNESLHITGAELRAKEPVNRTGDHTLTADDQDRYQRFTGTALQTLTLPAASSDAYVVGADYELAKLGENELEIDAPSGVVLNPPRGGQPVLLAGDRAVLRVVAVTADPAAVEIDIIGSTKETG